MAYDPSVVGDQPDVTMPTPVMAEETDQRVILDGLSWAQYRTLADAVDRPGLRMTFLDGELEIMSPSRLHEHWTKLIARLVEAYADERDIPLIGIRSTTLRNKLKKAGVEPDESYFVKEEKKVPDLAIEVVLTSGGIDKLEVYRRLGVPEVWFYVTRRLHVFRLGRGGYKQRAQSVALPGLDVPGLAELVASTPIAEQAQAVKRFRLALRKG